MLPASRVEQPPKLLLFSHTGFTQDLKDQSASRPDVEFISLNRIYQGE